MQNTIVPTFFLYGEPPREAVDRFLHIEALDDRSRPNGWSIRLHSHAELHHLFHIDAGGGTLRVEDARLRFEAPCLLIVPARTPHGFRFDTETSGTVLTLSDGYLGGLVARDDAKILSRLFCEWDRFPLPPGNLAPQLLARLARELGWEAPGHAIAVEACVLSLLVEVVRLAQRANTGEPSHLGPHVILVARFRELVEQYYREPRPLARYANQLGVTEPRLRAACRLVAGSAPLRLIQDRQLLEAKRALLYTNMTVGEAGYYLGFEDPAYFSRFFSRGVGESPRRFRARRAAGGEVGAARTRSDGSACAALR